MSGLEDQQALENFYVSLQFSNPAMATIMSDDIRTVALYGVTPNRERAYPAVIRLRNRSQSLPIPQAQILDHALAQLGYSILHIMETQRVGEYG